MGRKFDFQYLILGGGVAGGTLAMVLAKNKKKVAIVSSGITEKSAQKFVKNGITVICGRGKMKDQNTVTVLGQDFTAKTIIIATGRKMNDKKIDGLHGTKFLTIGQVIKMQKTPRTALVIGGGIDGCRAAEKLAQGGSKVILAEKTSRLIPDEEPEVGPVFHEYLKKELGIMILLGAEVTQVKYDARGFFEAIFTVNGSERKVKVNAIVLAIDKKPVVNLDLEKVGIKYGENGIKVDSLLRTNLKNIYAAGGVINGKISRERANYMGLVLGRNLVTCGKNLFNYSGFMRVAKTYLEMAAIGFLENELKVKKIKYKKTLIPLSDTEASEQTGFKYGFVKILVDKQDKLLGVTIVAPSAEAMIQELVLAMRQQIPISQVAGTPHPLGDFSVAIKMAAKKLSLEKKIA